jgi:hypothetical protein
VEVWLATEKETKAEVPFIVPRNKEFILKSVFIFVDYTNQNHNNNDKRNDVIATGKEGGNRSL